MSLLQCDFGKQSRSQLSSSKNRNSQFENVKSRDVSRAGCNGSNSGLTHKDIKSQAGTLRLSKKSKKAKPKIICI